MFEVVEPQLDGDEVFDSSLLKLCIESMIAAGKRNICVDLAGQDYLYSDAINALIGINKRMLDVMGRLSLVAPQPPVLEILKKGGIANILKIFENDNELMQVSQQFMGGAPAVAVAPPPPPPPQEPQSEFDELRSEIGSAFGNIAQPPQQQAPQRMQAPPPQSPFADASFPTARTPQQPRQPLPPPAAPAPRKAPPPPPLRPFEPAAQKPVPRPVVPPPQPPTRQPAVPLASGAETRRMPSVPETPVPPAPPAAARQEALFEPVAAPKPESDLEQFESTLEKQPPEPAAQKRDHFDEDTDVIKKKRSFAPVLVTLIILILLGGGGYYAYTTGALNKPPFVPAVTPAPEPAIPQVPVPAPEPVVAEPVDTAPVAAPAVEPAPEVKPVKPAAPPVVDAKAAEAKEAAAKAAAEKAAAAREVAAAKAAAAKEAAAEKAAARKAAAGAAAEKAAAAKEAKDAASAASRESAIKAAAARGAAAREAAAREAASREVVEPPPPAPKTSAIEVFDEPAQPKPEASEPPPPPPPAPEPAAAAEPAGTETGTIFMSSNPPLADVFIDGRLIGKTSIKELTVPTGTHTVRLVKGDKEMTKQMTFLPGKNPSVFIPIK